MPLKSSRLGDVLRQEHKIVSLTGQCLWPAPYNRRTREAALAFLYACPTRNEANSSIEPFPQMDGIEVIVDRWFTALETGDFLLIEKSRRLGVTWWFCILYLWLMGLESTQGVMVGVKYEKATGFVWRLEFLYLQLRRAHIGWELPPHGHIRYEGMESLKEFSLPNGSTCVAWNQEPESFRSDGKTFIHMEEPSTYRNPLGTYAQAKIVTGGIPGRVGGMRTGVSNAWPGSAWKELKKLRVIEGDVKRKRVS